MKRILISWVANTNDFLNGHVNHDGPTFNFHEYFYSDYDKHLLLTSEFDDKEHLSKGIQLFSGLKHEFKNHEIELRFLNIPQNEVVNFNHIHSKIYPLLLEFKNCEIDLFVSPGTPTMQVVWYIVHLELNLNTRLLQTKAGNRSSNLKPELSEINIKKTPFAQFHFFAENYLKTDIKKDNIIESEHYFISDNLKPIYNLAKEIAQTSKTTVVIYGETGTGKEHLAEQIHKDSSRKNNLFLPINCASIGSDLLESRLFGYEQGAFTNAIKTTKGYFHEANNGTIFLDEIGDISPMMQIALLRVLQSGEIQKVGSSKIEKVDVRIIVATNKDLYFECCNGNFRWDLFYRLNVAELTLPPLRERGHAEISELISFFTRKYAKYLQGIRKPITFTAKAMQLLYEHPWPGNIRELENLIERCYAYGLEVITPENLPKKIKYNEGGNSLILKDVIKEHVKKVVSGLNGNLAKAKSALGLGSINTVKKYMK
jgi:transcriptional regulator with PAS, ATPase and Fis domain